MMNVFTSKHALYVMILVTLLSFLPFIGLTDYHTKGEPRESIVSYTMIAQDNWVTPHNNGGEIAYKPPFFHWSIAALAVALNGGEVTEAISRLPSVLAMILMTLGTYLFFARRKGWEVALLTGFITLTNFELHRAAMNCRVDMVLTACTVMALYALYRWYEKGMKGIPLWAVLFMSLGTLTKGPVGMILPCLVTGCFLLLRGVNFWKAFLSMVSFGLLSLLLPAVWYAMAYMRQGDEFIALMLEENVGRMTSTMAYESCVNPWYYNVFTLTTGYVPWVLLLLFSLIGLRLSKPMLRPSAWWSQFTQWLRALDPVHLFSLLAVVIIFLFYCIPMSKRSVYLMPIYPFIAYFVAKYLLWLAKNNCKAIKVYGGVLAVIGIALFACFLLVTLGVLHPESLFHGRHAADNIRYFYAIQQIRNIAALLLITLPFALALYWWKFMRNATCRSALYYVVTMTFCLYFALDGAYQPAVLNEKSDKKMAMEMERIIPKEAPVYSFIRDTMHSAGDPIHYFITNFYLKDRVDNFYTKNPTEGYLLVGDKDEAFCREMYEPKGYTFEEVYRGYKRTQDVGQVPVLYRFKRNASSLKERSSEASESLSVLPEPTRL